MLEPIAEKVTLVHRRDAFRAHEHSVDQLYKSSVEVITPYVPVEITGDEKIEAMTLRETRGEKEMTIDVDSDLGNYGFISRLGLIADWVLELERISLLLYQKTE